MAESQQREYLSSGDVGKRGLRATRSGKAIMGSYGVVVVEYMLWLMSGRSRGLKEELGEAAVNGV